MRPLLRPPPPPPPLTALFSTINLMVYHKYIGGWHARHLIVLTYVFEGAAYSCFAIRYVLATCEHRVCSPSCPVSVYSVFPLFPTHVPTSCLTYNDRNSSREREAQRGNNQSPVSRRRDSSREDRGRDHSSPRHKARRAGSDGLRGRSEERGGSAEAGASREGGSKGETKSRKKKDKKEKKKKKDKDKKDKKVKKVEGGGRGRSAIECRLLEIFLLWGACFQLGRWDDVQMHGTVKYRARCIVF